MSYTCQYCQKSFLTDNNLKKHINSPSKKCLELMKKVVPFNNIENITGVPFYPMHTFICERFFSTYLTTKKFKIKQLC